MTDFFVDALKLLSAILLLVGCAYVVAYAMLKSMDEGGEE
jgi:hypothetical protein